MQYVDLTKTVERHQQKKVLKKKQAADRPRKRRVFAIAVIVLSAFFVFLFRNNVAALFSPVSIVSNIIRSNLKSEDGRTNILVLGKDSRSFGTEHSILTDTLLFTSIGHSDGSVAMISLPRDLWVRANGGTPHYLKINAVYAVDGVEELLTITEEVLGMPVHYYVVVDFNLFRDVIDTLGGVEVNVSPGFVDYEYPVEGKEADTCGMSEEDLKALEEEEAKEAEEGEEPEEPKERKSYLELFPCRYQTVVFESGPQTMNGETALKYVRSRHGTNGEGTDFARARRQQNLIMAVKDKVINIETILDLGKIKNLYDAYAANIDTNIVFDDVQGFWNLSQRIDFDSMRSIVLDDRSVAEEGGILYSPTDNSLYGGAYVLLPKSGDYSQIRAYVQRYIFGE